MSIKKTSLNHLRLSKELETNLREIIEVEPQATDRIQKSDIVIGLQKDKIFSITLNFNKVYYYTAKSQRDDDYNRMIKEIQNTKKTERVIKN